MSKDSARVVIDVKVAPDVGEMLDHLNDVVVTEMKARNIKRKRGEKSYRARVAAACIRAGYPKVLKRVQLEGPSAV